MPQFAANLSMMYPDLEFPDRFEAAARDGFKGVEFLWPYAWDAADIKARLLDNGLQQVLFNLPPGGLDRTGYAEAAKAGKKGCAALPGMQDEFRHGLQIALAYAAELGCPRLHAMAGTLPPSLTRAEAQAIYVANLRWAAREAAKQGVDILIEPLNTRDNPGYFLNRQDHAHEVVQAVGESNVKVQFDLYHCQIVEGDLASKVRQYLPTGRVGHIQIAGVPERHEPDWGEVNYPYLFDVIDEISAKGAQGLWSGWIGCEYKPRLGLQPGGTTAGLGWRR
ncbi:MAG: hypothetical protein RLZZ126_1452 [Pseudomonadota bacterium]